MRILGFRRPDDSWMVFPVLIVVGCIIANGVVADDLVQPPFENNIVLKAQFLPIKVKRYC